MKIRSSHIFIFAAALTLCGCQNELDSTHVIINGVSFSPTIDGTSSVEVTRASAFRSEDGSLEIPAWLFVSDGIGETASALTRGEQVNTGNDSQMLASFAKQIDSTFFVTGWTGSTPARFIPSSGSGYATVTYSGSAWSTISTDWDGSQAGTFFAYANCPSDSTVATVSNSYSTYQTLTYSAVPTDASLQKDILLGYYYGNGTPVTTGKTCTADLQFHHPLTAVRFKKGSFSGTVKFKAIYLDGVYKNGTAMMLGSGTSSNIAWVTTSSTKQEVGQEGDSYLAFSTDSIIGEPFLLIPQTITASAPVTVTIVAEIDNVVHPLTATLDPVEWQQGKTYTYKLGCENFELTVDGEVSTDYTGSGNRTYSVNSSADWKLQYTTDGGSTWTDAVANTQIGGWIKFDKVSGNGSSSSQTVTATVTAGTSMNLPSNHDVILQSATPKGTADAPYDLSMHTIYGEPRTAGPVTANSYVINAPGWYAFPLVYGNAIDYNKVPSGGVNTQAFDPSGNPSDIEYLTCFIDSEGEPINSPYISGATSAYPYWEDVPSYALIAQNGCSILNRSQAAAKGLTGCNCDYVVFQVPTTLTQGNAVIAVSNSSHILWSWHIWVTDMDLTCRNVTNSGATFSKGIMPLNLGWVDLATSIGYERKKLQVRFVQMKDGVVKNEVDKYPERREYVTETPGGQSPTYQWGRKDPFIRFKPDGTELSASEFSGTGIIVSWASGLLQTSIQNPTQFFRSDNGTGNTGWHIGGGKYVNLWSSTLKPTLTEGYSAAPVKTVYDPCPPGFQVPQMDAFNLWTGDNGVWNGGYSVKTSASGDEYIFFPAVGFRNGRSIYASATWYTEYFKRISRYWTAAPNNDGSGKIMAFQFRVDKNDMSIDVQCDKTNGNSIRPVQETSGKY